MKKNMILALGLAGCMAVSMVLPGVGVSAQTVDVATENVILTSSSEATGSDTAAMSIGEITFGRAQANASTSSANATTAFGTNQVTSKVSATCTYYNISGNKKTDDKSSSAIMVASVSFSHSKTFSIKSTHNATKGSQSADTKTLKVFAE